MLAIVIIYMGSHLLRLLKENTAGEYGPTREQYGDTALFRWRYRDTVLGYEIDVDTLIRLGVTATAEGLAEYIASLQIPKDMEEPPKLTLKEHHQKSDARAIIGGLALCGANVCIIH